MHVFVTGATGYIGSAVVRALRNAGHEVSGLVRSEPAAQRLELLGGRPVRGELADTAVLARAARAADGVIHAASTGDARAPEADALAVDTLLAALAESGKPFLYTSGVWLYGDTGDRLVDETSPLDPVELVRWRVPVEQRVLAAAARGVRSVVLRPAVVWGRGGGLLGAMAARGRRDGVVRYVGDGSNRWPLVHVDDLAEGYRLALEHAPAGSLYLLAHGPSRRLRDLAAEAAAAISTPDRPARAESWPLDQARARLGPYADALALDQQVSAVRAMHDLGWMPRRTGGAADG